MIGPWVTISQDAQVSSYRCCQLLITKNWDGTSRLKISVISKPVPFLLDYQGQPPLLPTAKFPAPQKGFQINLSSQVQSIQLCNLGGIPLHWATCTWLVCCILFGQPQDVLKILFVYNWLLSSTLLEGNISASQLWLQQRWASCELCGTGRNALSQLTHTHSGQQSRKA